jgi:gamma-glutamylcyclotransferase (GGCT)/AIG2-like uncharacterized protein YtfP
MKYTNDIRALADIVHNLNRSEQETFFVDKCQKLFSALESILGLYIEYAITENKLSEWAQRQFELGKFSINNKFSETVNTLLTYQEKNNLIDCKAFKEIIYFTPRIMSDSVLASNRYNPENISSVLRDLASATHRKLIESYNYSKPKVNILITNLCKLLYEVRSNMKHCGKTPYGPDRDKSKRDEEICKLIHPTLVNIIDFLLEKPNKKLVLYGTLKSGQPNALIIDNLRKESEIIKIFGFIEIENDLQYYTFTISNPRNEIEAELITNNNLVDKFDKIDEFEGKTYRRIKVPYKKGEEIGIGQIYEKNGV